ncbi:MAG: hypothetical protein ACF8Q5_02605 [Phycisphaerales bacterium JB040]
MSRLLAAITVSSVALACAAVWLLAVHAPWFGTASGAASDPVVLTDLLIGEERSHVIALPIAPDGRRVVSYHSTCSCLRLVDVSPHGPALGPGSADDRVAGVGWGSNSGAVVLAGFGPSPNASLPPRQAGPLDATLISHPGPFDAPPRTLLTIRYEDGSVSEVRVVADIVPIVDGWPRNALGNLSRSGVTVEIRSEYLNALAEVFFETSDGSIVPHARDPQRPGRFSFNPDDAAGDVSMVVSIRHHNGETATWSGPVRTDAPGEGS